MLRALADTEDARDIATHMLGDLLNWRPNIDVPAFHMDMPYCDLGFRRGAGDTRKLLPVFITARFRSGSTLLWNLFRHIDGCTSFYEPLNERRWFDPAVRGTRVDATHAGIDNYWREYDGLEGAGRYFREQWATQGLYMDGSSWDPRLKAYVNALIDHAPARAVLQFNRIDFRLAWFRHTFPDSVLVHLYRHPRDQWCSTLPDWSGCPADSTMSQFWQHDHYYLLPWAADLKRRFPFLAPSEISHPYRLFLLIWNLSFCFGIRYSHYSLSYESLTTEPDVALPRLMSAVGMEADLDKLRCLIRPAQSQWPRYASAEWFEEHEHWCQQVLDEFFVPQTRRTHAPGKSIHGDARRFQETAPATENHTGTHTGSSPDILGEQHGSAFWRTAN